MKKIIAYVLILVCVLGLAGCNKKSMNYIISHKPSVTGIVEEVYENSIVMYSDSAKGYPYGSRWSIPLKVENQDSYTDLVVGDEIVVYYGGSVMETDPLQVGTVYAITLKEPADRSINEEAFAVANLFSNEKKLMSAEDGRKLAELLAEGSWNTEGTTECFSNLEITINQTTYKYHSDCGTFNDKGKQRYLALDEEMKAEVNRLIEEYVSLNSEEGPVS